MKKRIVIKESQYKRILESANPFNGENFAGMRYGTYFRNPETGQMYLILNDERIPVASFSSQGEIYVTADGNMFGSDDPNTLLAKLDFIPEIGFQLERLNDTDYYFYANKKTYNVDGETKQDDNIIENKRVKSDTYRRRLVTNKLYTVTQKLTQKMFKDDNWESVRHIVDQIRALPFIEDVDLGAKDGGYRTYPNGSQAKEYILYITTTDGLSFEGQLKCHAAGTEKDPFSMYDITVTLF